MINSRFPLFSATPQRFQPHGPSHRRAPLLPKLRGHFAEFLNHSSPERLSIFNLTTCVGLGYGPNMHSLEAFLDSTSTPHSPQKGLCITPQPKQCPDLPRHQPQTLTPTIHSAAWLPYCVTPSLGPQLRPHTLNPSQHSKSINNRSRTWLVSLLYH